VAAGRTCDLTLYSVQVLADPKGRNGTILGAALVAVYAVFVADYLVRL
jgi:hypothetical protein